MCQLQKPRDENKTGKKVRFKEIQIKLKQKKGS